MVYHYLNERSKLDIILLKELIPWQIINQLKNAPVKMRNGGFATKR